MLNWIPLRPFLSNVRIIAENSCLVVPARGSFTRYDSRRLRVVSSFEHLVSEYNLRDILSASASQKFLPAFSNAVSLPLFAVTEGELLPPPVFTGADDENGIVIGPAYYTFHRSP